MQLISWTGEGNFSNDGQFNGKYYDYLTEENPILTSTLQLSVPYFIHEVLKLYDPTQTLTALPKQLLDDLNLIDIQLIVLLT